MLTAATWAALVLASTITASVAAPSGTTRIVMLGADLPANVSPIVRPTLPTQATFTLTAISLFLDDYVQGEGAKPAASISSRFSLCIAN